ncbi:MAG TPA: DEAD/DEAH box helicase [Chloroflexota bacterium]
MVVPATSFTELSVGAAVLAALSEMGIDSPTPIQSQAIPPLLEGKDVIGQARTGSGKTLAFGIPIVERCDPTLRGVQALILTPTRELAIQVASVLEQVAAARQLWVTLVYGGTQMGPEVDKLRNGAQIVVGTPGRVLDHLWNGNLPTQDLRIFVLDEGDEMLDQGFAPDIEKIISMLPQQRQTALFSATVPDWVKKMAASHLHNPVTVAVDAHTQAPPEIEQVVYDVPSEAKFGALCTLLDLRGEDPILVFGRTKIGVERLARDLRRKGYPVAALQGNLDQSARERVMSGFRSGQVPILVATNVAARGLDVSGIEAVINYELPESAELFTHRAGRTGRMGREGVAITFLAPEDVYKFRQIERSLGRKLQREPWPGTESATPSPETPRRQVRDDVHYTRARRPGDSRRAARAIG